MNLKSINLSPAFGFTKGKQFKIRILINGVFYLHKMIIA